MPDWLSILLGLLALIGSAELLVRGAVGMALALGISKMVVGLTIVAFGTSAPELVVAIADVLRDPNETAAIGGVALGTVFGSNLANIGLILGVTAMLKDVPLTGASLRFEAWWLLAATTLVILPPLLWGRYGHVHGGVLVAMVVTFTLLLLRRERRAKRLAAQPDELPDAGGETDADKETIGYHFLGNAGLAVAGLIGLRIGGGWLVDGCTGLAASLGVAESLIAATIVAIGSSLPELATALVAARRGHPELILGNIVGSNIFNICMVLGTAAAVRPLPVDWPEHGPRMLWGLGFAVPLAVMMLKRDRVHRPIGLVLLTAYLVHVTLDTLGG